MKSLLDLTEKLLVQQTANEISEPVVGRLRLDLKCSKTHFEDVPELHVSAIDQIETHGLLIHAAKTYLTGEWYILANGRLIREMALALGLQKKGKDIMSFGPLPIRVALFEITDNIAGLSALRKLSSDGDLTRISNELFMHFHYEDDTVEGDNIKIDKGNFYLEEVRDSFVATRPVEADR